MLLQTAGSSWLGPCSHLHLTCCFFTYSLSLLTPGLVRLTSHSAISLSFSSLVPTIHACTHMAHGKNVNVPFKVTIFNFLPLEILCKTIDIVEVVWDHGSCLHHHCCRCPPPPVRSPSVSRFQRFYLLI